MDKGTRKERKMEERVQRKRGELDGQEEVERKDKGKNSGMGQERDDVGKVGWKGAGGSKRRAGLP